MGRIAAPWWHAEPVQPRAGQPPGRPAL